MRTRCLPFLVLLFVAAILYPAMSSAQPGPDSDHDFQVRTDSTHFQILKTVEGDTFLGHTIELRAAELVFVTKYGEITIPLIDIKSIMDLPLEALQESGYWFLNPNGTRLFFAPKGRMLKKGAGYFQNIYVFFGGITIGVTDNITLGGGMSLFPGADEQLYYFTPKVGASVTRNLSVAAGALTVKIPDDEGSAGIYYGVGTYGSIDRSVTLGFGYAYRESDVESDAMIMWGLDYRISRRTALVSENWTFPGVDGPLISVGFRFFGEQIVVDLAFVTIPAESDGVFVPYVDFVICF